MKALSNSSKEETGAFFAHLAHVDIQLDFPHLFIGQYLSAIEFLSLISYLIKRNRKIFECTAAGLHLRVLWCEKQFVDFTIAIIVFLLIAQYGHLLSFG